MTTAVCFQYGDLKFGFFCLCEPCDAHPKTERELIISLAIGDYYFNGETFGQIGAAIRQRGSRRI